MAKRRIIRRRGKSSSAPAQNSTQKDLSVPVTRESFGLRPEENCEILIVGGANYCSFTLARLGRLGIDSEIGITNSESHAVWAIKNLAPKIVVSSIDYGKRSGGIELMHKLQSNAPGISVILTSSTLDISMDGRTLRDLAWGMSDSWSFITRRKTDNGDPLGLAIVAARQSVGWIDYTVRKQLDQWRVNASNNSTIKMTMEVPVAA